MKNIYILPTEQLSRFYYNRFLLKFQLFKDAKKNTPLKPTCNIYITSDDEIKEDNYCIDSDGHIGKAKNVEDKCNIDIHFLIGGAGLYCVDKNCPEYESKYWLKKIILTTDKELIKDGVQAIGHEFLEWFVKNSTCEFVELNKNYNRGNGKYYYKIIIPKEELKQQTIEDENYIDSFGVTKLEFQTFNRKKTLEEAAEIRFNPFRKTTVYNEGDITNLKYGFIEGAKWQEQRMFSREEVLEQLNLLYSMKNSMVDIFTDDEDYITEKWFELLKKIKLIK